MKAHFDPIQFITSWLFIAPGLIFIGIGANWYVSLGVLLVGIGFSIKVETK